MAMRNVISTLSPDGTEIMGPGILMYHYPGSDIMNGSLLTVESNHFCVLKSRGAVLNVYETGQYPVETPQRPLIGSFQQAFYGGQSPWQYEALFVTRAKSVVKAQGVALSRELAELVYDVDYYVHVDTREDAIKLVTHVPLVRHVRDQLHCVFLGVDVHVVVDVVDELGELRGQRYPLRLDHALGPCHE